MSWRRDWYPNHQSHPAKATLALLDTPGPELKVSDRARSTQDHGTATTSRHACGSYRARHICPFRSTPTEQLSTQAIAQ